jgi:hypothetical protein
MATDAFIQCRVTPAVKTLVRELAKRENITESALVKQLIEVVLRTSALASFPKIEELDRPNRDARLYVRLDLEDRMMLTSRAAERGMRSATYVSLLVRSHLRGVAPLPKEELLALKRSVAELTKPAVPGQEELRAMLKLTAGLCDHFKALLKANEQSWGQGHVETSH